ncbi:universal stress protein [uncultured Sunxiuqinia sp.]|uniref:universal stress protein n=1 Tax=uncultured Sunxiuqinia sp. TaxID=1573825 RepID=UPI002AA7C224|nr:universal stress protein [uncultured Sunxiuqinia sp.]
MKTNLLLLDTLKNMETLITSGFALSNQLKRKLKIVYVLDFGWMRSGEFVGVATPDYQPNVAISEAQFRVDYEAAEAEMKKTVADLLKKIPQSVPYELEVAEISRLMVVNDTIEKEKDVILLMSNYNSYSGFVTGAISYPNIIEKVDCPVIIVPDDTSTFSMSNFLYATALHAEDLKAMRHLSDMVEGTENKNLTIFHNMETTDFDSILKWKGFKDMAKGSIKNFSPSFVHSHEKDVSKGLQKHLEENEPDVLVIMKEEKGFFEDLFSSSETHYVVTHFNKPVLVYHESNFK